MKKRIIYTLAVVTLSMVSGLIGGVVGSRLAFKSGQVHMVSASDQGRGADPASANSLTEIGEEAAKSIALKDAGVAEPDVTNLRVIKEYDDGRVVYDIEFSTTNGTYHYEIDRITGEIVSYDLENSGQQSTAGQNGGGPQITLEEAKAIALSKTNMNENDVSFTKTELEDDDGRAVYQIDFIVNDLEYEVEIDANDGTLIGFDIEMPSE